MNSTPKGKTRVPFPVWSALGFYAAMAAIAILWRGWVDRTSPLLAPDGALGGPGHVLGQAALGVIVGALLVAASRWWTRTRPAGARLARAMARVLGPLSSGQVAVLALASGLAEEAFFRGALQPRVGWLLASLLFGLAHLVPRREWVAWSGFATLTGLLFGALFELCGSLVAPAVAHVLVNALNLRWLTAPDPSADPAGR